MIGMTLPPRVMDDVNDAWVGRAMVEEPTTKPLLASEIIVPDIVIAGWLGWSVVPAITSPFATGFIGTV